MAGKFFKEVYHIVLVYERHLAVYLCELRLTVCTQVFIAETFGNLEITVETADHKQLLQRLRTLRQSIELPWIHTGRDYKITRALGSTAYQDRSLNLYKIL